MKVTETIISIAKKPAVSISVGDQVMTIGNVKDIRTLMSINVTDNATYIELQDLQGKSLTYGSKIFVEKFKLKDK